MRNDANLCAERQKTVLLLFLCKRFQTGNSDLPGAPDPRRRCGADHSGTGDENASDTDDSDKTGASVESSAEKIAELFKETFWQEISPGEMNRLLHLLLEKVEVHEGKLTVEFKSSGIKTLMEEIANGEETD